MGWKKNLIILFLIIVFFVGFILFIDEIRIIPFLEALTPLLDDIGFPERILPDLSAFHIAGLHHWVFGVLIMLICCAGLVYTIKNIDD
ncbi:MAG: hypothetical protein ACFFAJ_09710 [Candidatus Hodarchaeota archaeon]